VFKLPQRNSAVQSRISRSRRRTGFGSTTTSVQARHEKGFPSNVKCPTTRGQRSFASAKHTFMKFLPLIFACLLLAGCVYSNEDFAKKVEIQMAEIARSKDARRGAVELCRPLPEERRIQEPQCVALQNEARGTPYKAPLPSDRSTDRAF
jgi:hypothetical protein